MTPDKVLSHAPVVLSEAQRRFYFENGFLGLPGYVPETWLARLRGAMAELLERSRGYSQSDQVFVLEEGHSAAQPRLHRVAIPEDQHPVFAQFFADPVMTDLAADVVGPDVKFHHGKLNLKSAKGSRGFKWHQDIQSWPHTDFSPVTVGVYIDGCEPAMGPVAFVRGSHKGKLHSMYDDAGKWAVRVAESEIDWTDDMVEAPVGPPGTVVLINCRVIHGSVNNDSGQDRPLLLNVYSSADSFAFTPAPLPSSHLGDIVRGRPARYLSMEPYPAELPPDFRGGGYRMPWLAQKDEEERKRAVGY